MKKFLLFILCIVLLYLIPQSSLIETARNSSYSPLYAKNEILLKFKSGILTNQIEILMSEINLKEIEEIPHINVHRVKIPSRYSINEIIEVLNENPLVEYAEPNYILYLASIPNDPYFKYQWALRNIGQEIAPPEFNLYHGNPNSDIKAWKAWDIEKGNEYIIIGVVDTGVALNHPDLKNNIISSGRDFANNDFYAMDDHGHGTHVAGIISASSNNGTGVTGVCWKCKILPVKVFNENAIGLTSWVANGIIWAADHGARVINLSLGGPDVVPNRTLKEAIKYAFNKNVVLVAAAGNDGKEGVWYPAAWDDYVIAVSATDYNDKFVTFEDTDGRWGSNYGPEVDVAAPGYYILSTWGMNLWLRGHPGWRGYSYGNKTSMSTAFVSGEAALILSHMPSLSNKEVMNIIRYTADDVNSNIYPGKDIYIGYGRINLKKALDFVELLKRANEITLPFQRKKHKKIPSDNYY